MHLSWWVSLAASLALACAAQAAVAAVPDTMEQRAKACTGCHGLQGQSRPDGYVPRLAGKPAGYLFVQLQAFRDGQRPHAAMARLLEHLDDAMLQELATHFASLTVPYPAPVTPLPAPDRARKAEALVRQGDAARDIPACATCHGESLTGTAPFVPGLVGLPRDYIAGQLGAWRQGVRRGHAPDCMATVARRLTVDDVAAVSQWLAAQPVPAVATSASQAAATWPMECGIADPAAARRAAAAASPPAGDAASAATTRAGDGGGGAPGRGDLVARGAYLARVGNCAGCHTAPGGAAYAGGVGIATPFGTVYAGNLTPDPQTGLGRWTTDDFHRALHEGRSRDGRRLAPAFPYTSYTHVTRADSDAIFAYLQSLPPVVQPQRAHELRFPFGTQAALAAWQWLYFKPASTGTTPPSRGRYLVEGLGHCTGCHSPRNLLGAPADSLTGGDMPAQGWYAPSLHPAPGTRAEAAQVAQLLRTGRSAQGSVSGPMAAVVRQSTQYYTDDDLRAVADYVASLPPARATTGSASAAAPDVLAEGERLYLDRCADCHGRDGRGAPGAYPPLAGNPTVLQPGARNLAQVVRNGTFGPATAVVPHPYGMPPQDFTDAQMAAVLSYVRQAWGNGAPAVTSVDVVRSR